MIKKTMADDDKIINFEEARLKLAPKEPPQGGNWLSRLPFETRFLASKKNTNDAALMDFIIASDPTQLAAVYLGYELNHRDGGFRWFDPVKFSRDYEFYMTIETRVEQENGNGITVETGGVVGDGETQVVDSLHEDK